MAATVFVSPIQRRAMMPKVEVKLEEVKEEGEDNNPKSQSPELNEVTVQFM